MSLHLPFSESLVVVGTDDQQRTAQTGRGRVVQRYGDRVELRIDDEPGTATSKGLPPLALDDLSETERWGVEALQLRQSPAYQRAKAARPRQGETWDMPGYAMSTPTDFAARASERATTSRARSPSGS